MSLQDEVAKHVKLDRRGWGCCPFHQEKTASFHVFIARKGKHRGQEIYYCQGCRAMGDGADWQLFITGHRGAIPREDPEVRRLRLAEQRVAAERERILHKFLDRYPDTPVEAFDFLDSVQQRLQAARDQQS
jgi:hypothetical protein